jgi:GTPase SAR1 family protein
LDLGASFWEKVRSPGLALSSFEVKRLVELLPKRLAAFSYKKKKDFLWVVVMGGTGTGKSTIFNALCGKSLSETGVERPKTYGPIVYAYRKNPIESDFPFPSIRIRRVPIDQSSSHGLHTGIPGEFIIIEHDWEELSHLAFVDTPDLDSLVLLNREMAEDLYLLADAVIFVTSQEKYADEAPFQYLLHIHGEGKPYFLILNKADAAFARDELPASFRAHGLSLKEKRTWLLPYTAGNPQRLISENPEFRDFRHLFFKAVSKDKLAQFLREERKSNARAVNRQLLQLLDLLEKERQAAQRWLEQLEAVFASVSRNLLDEQHRHFTEESREYLQQEIRNLFSRYDVLAKPRRFVASIVRTPLRLLGLVQERPADTRREALMKVRGKIDLTPIRAAIAGFNRAVIEKLSPEDETSPLYRKVRQPAIALTDEEIKIRVWEEQERLAAWLEEKFQQLAKGIPKSKELGIYSTSVAWGLLIISFEVAIGGGISLLEALLDSAIAPFVTKGAMELFAYHEIQQVARELALRYEKGLLSVVSEQRDRYVEAMTSLMTSREALDALRTAQRSLQSEQEGGGWRG